FGNKVQEKYTKLYGTKNPMTASSASPGMWRGINLCAESVKAAKNVKLEEVAAALDKAKLAEGVGGGCEVVPGTWHVKMNMFLVVKQKTTYEIVEKSKG